MSVHNEELLRANSEIIIFVLAVSGGWGCSQHGRRIGFALSSRLLLYIRKLLGVLMICLRDSPRIDIPRCTQVLQEVVEIEWGPRPHVTRLSPSSTGAGPDGLMCARLLSSGEELHAWIANMFTCWMESYSWPEAMKETYLAPIPKTSHAPARPDGVRLVCLINTIAKVCVSPPHSLHVYASYISTMQRGALPGRRVEELVIDREVACFKMAAMCCVFDFVIILLFGVCLIMCSKFPHLPYFVLRVSMFPRISLTSTSSQASPSDVRKSFGFGF